MFETLKFIHVAAVITTGLSMITRGAWALQGSPKLQHPFVRIAPHVIDTVLFLSAIAMAIMIRQYPFVTGWLTAKFVALLAYITLGHIALKRRSATALAAALLTLAYIVGVALCRDPLTCLLA